jgi:hypothetical protein
MRGRPPPHEDLVPDDARATEEQQQWCGAPGGGQAAGKGEPVGAYLLAALTRVVGIRRGSGGARNPAQMMVDKGIANRTR